MIAYKLEDESPFDGEVEDEEVLRKQRESCIKLQNEMLQIGEEQLDNLHCMIGDFPPID
jgi:hypothetical protein